MSDQLGRVNNTLAATTPRHTPPRALWDGRIILTSDLDVVYCANQKTSGLTSGLRNLRKTSDRPR